MDYIVFDVEADGLLDSITKIHCLSYQKFHNNKEIFRESLTEYDDIIDFLNNSEILVGHNIVRYDIPALEKILGVEIKPKLIDTLALSWYLFPDRIFHDLDSWGDYLGTKKPEIEDWKNLNIQEYIHRCEEDVKINVQLFNLQLETLRKIYSDNPENIGKIIDYLTFKMDCAREQEEVKCKIDVEDVTKNLKELSKIEEEKLTGLQEAMPTVIKYKVSKYPSKFYRKDGSISATGNKRIKICESLNLPQDYKEDISYPVYEVPGNPKSVSQLKDWLFALGWEPQTFEFRVNSKGIKKKVPQLYFDGEVCPSIKILYNIEPALESLDMLSLIKHRVGIFKAFLKDADRDNYVIASIAGFTNTLRFRHKKPITNLPKVEKFYGEQIRGSIIAPGDDYLLCGSDMSSLEDTTKQHYMYFFDPEYVKQIRVPGFDPHLDIGVLSGLISEEEKEFYVNCKKELKNPNNSLTEDDIRKYDDISVKRTISKVVNFAGVYGASPKTMARAGEISLEEAVELHKIYWKRNEAVKKVSKNCKINEVYIEGRSTLWLYNPVSKFWYSLRHMKDAFSTLNQGTGVFCFDTFVREVRREGIRISLQYHDEIAFPLLKESKEVVRSKLNLAIDKVNKRIKLNVPLGISIDFGYRYSEIH